MMSVAWSVGSFAFLLLVFAPLERLFPARRQRVFRFEFRTDCLFFFGAYLLWGGLVVSALIAFSDRLDGPLLAGTGLSQVRAGAARLPVWAQALGVVLSGDLLVYWGHRLSHRVELLWRFHRVHHTAERLDWLAAHREHPLDGLYTQLLVNLPAIVLGFPVATIAGVAAFRGMWGLFIHSNVRLRLGPVKVLLGAPELHHWHHDLERGHTCNFANLMPVMDLLFGTYYDPGPEPARYGIPERVPRGYVGQILYPLVPSALWWRVAGRLARRPIAPPHRPPDAEPTG